jgi:4-hydroxy-tetrahydrodipicolinate synthase
MFSGCFTALVTPFTADGAVDYPKLAELIEQQIAGGVAGIVPTGTTGESATLSHEEHHRVIERAVQVTRKRCLVIAGTGSNATTEAISLTQAAEAAGADASLQVSPYYNKPSPEGMYRHFMAIARATKLPLVLYNIPGRTGKEIAVETLARLAKDAPNVVAVKEAGGSVERVTQTLEAAPRLEILSGDDSLTLAMMAVGAKGVISVLSNLLPADVKRLVTLAAAGKLVEAEALHRKMAPLVREIFRENNPAGIKAALALAGRCGGTLRLPLCEILPENMQKLAAALKAYGVKVKR